MSDITLIFTVLFAFGWVCCAYFLCRSQKVSKFRRKIKNLSFNWSIEHLEEDSAFNWFFNKMPSYEKMLFSVKPLKLKTYFTEEEIKRIMS